MALDQLLAALEREAQADAASVLAAARAEADDIAAASDARLALERERALGMRTRAMEADLEAEYAAARLVARRLLLEARAALLGRVFAAVDANLPDVVSRPDYLSQLSGRIAVALACVGEEEAVVLSGPASLANTLSESCRDVSRVTIEVDPHVGSGICLTTADGAIQVIDTLDARVAARRPALARQALALLGVES